MEQHKEIVELTNSTRKLIKLLVNLYILSGKGSIRRWKPVHSFTSIASCCDSPDDNSRLDRSIHDVLIIKLHKQDKNYPKELVINFASVPQDLNSKFKFTMGLIHRIIFPCIQKPIVIFNIPICCLSYANINIETFRSEFTLFLRMRPRLMEFEEFYAFCKVLLLTYNKVVFTRTCCNGCHIKKKITRQMSTLNMHIFYQFSLYLFYRHVNKFNVDFLDLMLIYKKLDSYVGWNYFKTSLMFFKRGEPIKFTRRSKFWLEYYTKHASRPDLTLLGETEAETFYFLNELCRFGFKIEKEAQNNEIYSDHNFSHIGLMNLDSGQSVGSVQIKNAFSCIVPVKTEQDPVGVKPDKNVTDFGMESDSTQSNEKLTHILSWEIERDSKTVKANNVKKDSLERNLNNLGSSMEITKMNTESTDDKSQFTENKINKIQQENAFKTHIFLTGINGKDKGQQQRFENRVQIIEVSENSNSSSEDEVQVLSNPNIAKVIGILDDNDSSVENLSSDYEKEVIYISDDSTSSVTKEMSSSRKQYATVGSNDFDKMNECLRNLMNSITRLWKSVNDLNDELSLSSQEGGPSNVESKTRAERAQGSVDEGWETIDHFRFFSSLEGVKAGPSNGVKDVTGDRVMEICGLRSGKEDVDEIDGINFISFETESDMFDYTRREMLEMIKHFSNKHFNNPKSSLIAQKRKNIGKTTIPVDENKKNSRTNTELKMLNDFLKSVSPHNVDDLFDGDCTVTQSIPSSNKRCRKQVETSSPERHKSSRQKRRKPPSCRHVNSTSSDSEVAEPNVLKLDDRISNITCDSKLSEENGECLNHTKRIDGHKFKSGFENPSILSDLKRNTGTIPSTVHLERLTLEMISQKEKTTNSVKDANISSDIARKPKKKSISNKSKLSSCTVDNVVHSKDLPKDYINRFPIILPCNDVNGEHDGCLNVEKCESITLGLVLNIGKNRPFPKEVSENLELLKNDSNIVDDRSALIAASAVVPRNSPKTTIKRVIVPVMSKPLLQKAVLHLKSVADARNSAAEVKNVVSDVVDYVVKRDYFEKLTFHYDPDVPSDRKHIKCTQKKQETRKVKRKPRKLDKFKKSQTQETGKCSKDFCSKGCICGSLNRTHTLSHCYELKCMFNCICSDKKVSDNQYNPRKRNNTLTQEESSSHQTVTDKDNSFEFEDDLGKPKRAKKMPARFQDEIIYGTEMMNISNDLNKINLLSPQQPFHKELKDSVKSSHKFKQSRKATKKSPTTLRKPETTKNDFKSDQMNLREHKKSQRRVNKDKENYKPTRTIDEEETHSDDIEEETHSDSIEEESHSDTIGKDTSWTDEYWLWCAVHSCYGCNCSSQLYFLKNALDCGTAEKRAKLFKKEIPDLISHYSNVCHLYNKNKYCARTFGAVMDYSKRNKSTIFRSKRLYEIQNDIKTFSNSLIKSRLITKYFAVTGYIEEKEPKDIFNVNSDQIYKKNCTIKKPTPQIPLNNIKKKTIHFDMACKSSLMKPNDNSKNNINTDKSLLKTTPVVKQINSNLSDPYALNVVASPISLADVFASEPIAAQDGLQQSAHDNATDLKRTVPSTTNEEDLNACDMPSPSTSSAMDFNSARSSTSNEEISKALNKRSSLTSNAADLKRIVPSTRNEEILKALNKRSPPTSNATDFNRIRPLTSKDQPSSISPDNFFGSASSAKPVAFEHVNQVLPTTNAKPKTKYRIGPAYSNAQAIKLQTTPTFPNKLKTVPVLSKVSPDDYTTLRTISRGFTNTKDHTVIFPQNNNSNVNQDVPAPIDTEPQDSETEDETYGLLCLAKGFGYLAVQSVSGESIVVEDPLAPQVYHSFSNTRAAVKWLNKFLKNRLLFEDHNITLPWALVKGSILKRFRPFDRTIFRTKSKKVTKKGELVSKGEVHWLSTAATAKRECNRSTVEVDRIGNVSPALAKRPAQDDPNPERKKLKKVNIQSIRFDNGMEIQMEKHDIPTIQISDDED